MTFLLKASINLLIFFLLVLPLTNIKVFKSPAIILYLSIAIFSLLALVLCFMKLCYCIYAHLDLLYLFVELTHFLLYHILFIPNNISCPEVYLSDNNITIVHKKGTVFSNYIILEPFLFKPPISVFIYKMLLKKSTVHSWFLFLLSG